MSMALRGKAVTKEPDPEEPTQELLSQRRKPEIGQFRLQVDRQTKATFSTYEAAEDAGNKEGAPCGSGGGVRYRRVLRLDYRAPRDVISPARPVFNPPCEPCDSRAAPASLSGTRSADALDN
jgi:hypothetical protein